MNSPTGPGFSSWPRSPNPAAVPDAVAAVLGITQQPGKTVTESVASALEGRVRVLVFDKCEHVVDSVADLVEAILAASATITILATSREGLGVSDEQLWRVQSLDINAGTQSAAVNLFLDRAQSVVSDFSLAQPAEADAVVEICRRLDGIPLAIELAASRMASMTASEVRDRLDQRFRLLVGSRRGLERHQTLRHAVALRVTGVSIDPTVVVAHVAGPWPQPIDAWRRDLNRLPVTLSEVGEQAGARSVIVAADLNSTTDMRPFRALLRDGYRDAAEQFGAGIKPTFPANWRLPPFIAIDHILTRNCTATSLRTLKIPGSDHRGLVVTLAIPRSSARP
jgi:hypothetical protein